VISVKGAAKIDESKNDRREQRKDEGELGQGVSASGSRVARAPSTCRSARASTCTSARASASVWLRVRHMPFVHCATRIIALPLAVNVEGNPG